MIQSLLYDDDKAYLLYGAFNIYGLIAMILALISFLHVTKLKKLIHART